MGHVKTTISIEEKLFDQAEELARTLSIPRSQLFSQAIHEYLVRNQSQKFLEDINRAHEKPPTATERTHLSRMKTKLRRRVIDQW